MASDISDPAVEVARASGEPSAARRAPAEQIRSSAEDMQMQMLVAMGATPLNSSGAAGSARQASNLAQYAPLMEVAAAEAAWS